MSESKPKTLPVTRLVKLGTQAPTFDLSVTVTKLSGARAELSIFCKALRKTEWADLRDARQGQALTSVLKPQDAAAESADDALAVALDELKKRGHGAKVREGLRQDAETVMAFAAGWDLEDDFTIDALMALEDEFGGALSRILTAYDLAVFQGRLGN